MKSQILIFHFLVISKMIIGQGGLILQHQTLNTANIGPESHANGVFRYFVESDNLLRFGETEKAILALDKALLEQTLLAETYLKRALLLFKVGRIEEGHLDLDKAEKINPYVIRMLGPNRPYFKKEMIMEDTAFYRVAIMETYSDQKWIQQRLMDIAQAKFKGDLGKAMKGIDGLFKENIQTSAVLYGLRGNIHLMLREYDKAIQDYNKAIRMNPDAANFYFQRGFSRLFTYDRQSACIDLEKSEQLGHPGGTVKLQNFCFN